MDEKSARANERSGRPVAAEAWAEVMQGHFPGDQYLRYKRRRDFRRVSSGYLITRDDASRPRAGIVRALDGVKRSIVGRPLRTAEEPNERVSVFTGLAVFASDNISSSAYATEEIMRVLVLAGIGALSLTLPLTLGIIVVLAIVVTSYQQTIRAYPGGGGSYIVASDNLGAGAGLVAAAALLIDYVLTVSVSVAAGVLALTSVFPGMFEYRVLVGVGCVAVLCVGNLRGIRESGALFTAPTYVYLLSIFGLLAVGFWQYATGGLPAYVAPDDWRRSEGVETLGILLVLRAFASGSVALTGTEAVSNGVPAFRPPESRHAQTVLILMGASFATIFLGMSFLAMELSIIPDPTEQETVISQLTRTLVGDGSPYHYLVQLSTALLLVLAANTAFADFPRLASILARDRFLPRSFAFRGDRLAFSWGIGVLGAVAVSLIVAFEGSVTNLIPLYTVGVFVAFTLSQAGMVRHSWRLRDSDRGWWWRVPTSAVGGIATGVVAVVVGVAKFSHGAWTVLLLIPLLVVTMWYIHEHYGRMRRTERPETPIEPERVHPWVVVPLAQLDVPARQALAFAQAVAGEHPVTAVHVTDSAEEAEGFRDSWDASPHAGVELVVIESPYRALASPLLAFVDSVGEAHPGYTMVVVLPELVPGRWWEHLLHNQTALRLKAALLFHPGVIVASVPYHLART
ncbi:MAG: APC family permease [Chloroflexota bacterium]